MDLIVNDQSDYVKSACIESIGNMLEGKKESVDKVLQPIHLEK